jgi:hypothetical protein
VAIIATDILYKLSTTSGSAGNTLTGTPGSSLGKYISTTQITDATLSNLFLTITGDQNAAGQVDYQCVFVHNNHATLTLLAPYLWIYSETAGGATTALALDSTAASAIGSASAQALTIATSLTAPSGPSFSAPTTKSGGIAMGDIPAGYCKAFWVRRTASNTGAVDVDGVLVRVEGDTTA